MEFGLFRFAEYPTRSDSAVRAGDFAYNRRVTPIFRGSDYIEAHLLAGLLRQHGIGVFLQGALLQGGLGELPAVGHLALMVDDSDITAAKQIIAAYERGELQIDEEQDDAAQP